jgi:hypothetical protein
MAVPEFLTDQRTRDTLGEDGLTALADSLYLRDCQTCNSPLSSEPPSLWVDAMAGGIVASLHHPRCRPARWNDSGLIVTITGTASWYAVAVSLPSPGGRGGIVAALLVNPGLEQVAMTKLDGRWVIDPGARVPGLTRPGPDGITAAPLPQVTARASTDSVAVRVGLAGQVYHSGTTEEIREAVRRNGGLLLVLTHALDPAVGVTEENLPWLLSRDSVMTGWAPSYASP